MVEEISFNACELQEQARREGRQQYHCVIDAEQVTVRLGELVKAQDLSKYII